MDATIFTTDHVIGLCAVLGVLGGGWKWGTGRAEKKQTARNAVKSLKEKEDQETSDAARLALAGLGEIRSMQADTMAVARQALTIGTKVLTILEGRPPDAEFPNGTLGLVREVASLKPNGGNTNNTGDLVFKLAKQAGVTEDDDQTS